MEENVEAKRIVPQDLSPNGHVRLLPELDEQLH